MVKNEAQGPPAEFRRLPQVDRLSNALPAEAPAPLRVAAARTAISEASTAIGRGRPAPSFDELVEAGRRHLRLQARALLGRVVNATGVLLHTNLGRAPLAQEALDAVSACSSGYSNLEYDLQTASRGSRYEHAADLLKAVTGAESALVVNNNAAAVTLALTAVAKGREVIVSRGELIEIGGEFRIPEIMAESGAVMREVGTTNRTHLRDYRSVIGPETAAIIKIHPSNYRVVGFTASVAADEISGLCRERGIPFLHDLGSGLLRRRVAGAEPGWLAEEPSVEQALADGADLVTFSGDKLLGGPQAGIIAGKETLVARLRKSPLLRAFRVDKTTLAALQATLLMYLQGRESQIPFWRMALAAPETLALRCKSLAAWVEAAAPGAALEVVPGHSAPGGGSAPGAGIPTFLVRIAASASTASEVVAALVDNDPPVVARIEDQAVLIDLRTVQPEDDELLAEAVRRAVCT